MLEATPDSFLYQIGLWPQTPEACYFLLTRIRKTPHFHWIQYAEHPEQVLPMLRRAYCDARDLGEHGLMDWIWEWENKGNPPSNVWIGARVTNQEEVDQRSEQLLEVPCAIRFLSCELREAVELPLWYCNNCMAFRAAELVNNDKDYGCKKCHCYVTSCWNNPRPGRPLSSKRAIDWITCGATVHPIHPNWVRSVVRQAQAANIPFYFSGWGEWSEKTGDLPILPFMDDGKRGIFDENDLWRPNEGQFSRYENLLGKAMYRVGREAAGRELDGRTWDLLPQVASTREGGAS